MIRQKVVNLSEYDGQKHNFLTYSHANTLAGHIKDGWILKWSYEYDEKIVMVFEKSETGPHPAKRDAWYASVCFRAADDSEGP